MSGKPLSKKNTHIWVRYHLSAVGPSEPPCTPEGQTTHTAHPPLVGNHWSVVWSPPPASSPHLDELWGEVVRGAHESVGIVEGVLQDPRDPEVPNLRTTGGTENGTLAI